MSAPIAWDEEFRVNATPELWQHSVRVTALAGDRFVVTWRAQGETSSVVQARIFAADGTPVGGEFAVGGGPVGQEADPAVAALPGGGFVVVWDDEVTPPGGSGETVDSLQGQVFGPGGERVGGVFSVDDDQPGEQSEPEIAVLADGRFAVVWTGGEDDAREVHARIFAANGEPETAVIPVNVATTLAQRTPNIAATVDGGFVVTWTDFSGETADGSQSVLVKRAFGPNGAPLADVDTVVNTTFLGIQDESVVVQLAGGRIAVAWKGYSGPDGPDVSDDIYLRVFEADGTPVGTDSVVNADTAWGQFAPAIAALPDGRFILAWTTQTSDGVGGTQLDVMAQVFDADGAPADEAITVHSDLSGKQAAVSLAVLADGRVVVTWEDESGSLGDLAGVHGQILDLRDAGVTLSGTRGADTLLGSGWGDEIVGRGGNDRLVAAGGSDLVLGLGGNDVVRAGLGNDVVRGGRGRDVLLGEGGDDSLAGGADNDRLAGGEGADVFVFGRRDGKDRVLDWEDGADRLDLSGWDFATAQRALSFARQVGDDVVFSFGNGRTLTLEDTQRSELDANDLIL